MAQFCLNELSGGWGEKWSKEWDRGFNTVYPPREKRWTTFETFFSPIRGVNSHSVIENYPQFVHFASPLREFGIHLHRVDLHNEEMLTSLVDMYREGKAMKVLDKDSKERLMLLEEVLDDLLTERQKRYIGLKTTKPDIVTTTTTTTVHAANPIWIGIALFVGNLQPIKYCPDETASQRECDLRAAGLIGQGAFNAACLIFDQHLKSKVKDCNGKKSADSVLGMEFCRVVYLCNFFATELAVGGNDEAGMKLIEKALTLTKKSAFPSLTSRTGLRVATLNTKALLCRIKGCHQAAIEYLHRALKTSRKFKLHACEALTWVNLAVVQFENGRFESAAFNIGVASEIFSKTAASEAGIWLTKKSGGCSATSKSTNRATHCLTALAIIHLNGVIITNKSSSCTHQKLDQGKNNVNQLLMKVFPRSHLLWSRYEEIIVTEHAQEQQQQQQQQQQEEAEERGGGEEPPLPEDEEVLIFEPDSLMETSLFNVFAALRESAAITKSMLKPIAAAPPNVPRKQQPQARRGGKMSILEAISLAEASKENIHPNNDNKRNFPPINASNDKNGSGSITPRQAVAMKSAVLLPFVPTEPRTNARPTQRRASTSLDTAAAAANANNNNNNNNSTPTTTTSNKEQFPKARAKSVSEIVLEIGSRHVPSPPILIPAPPPPPPPNKRPIQVDAPVNLKPPAFLIASLSWKRVQQAAKLVQ